MANLRRTGAFDFQPHRVAPPPVVQFVLDRLEQVAHFLLVDVQFAVARHPQLPVAEDLRAGKNVRQEMADQVPEEKVILAQVLARQFDQARQHPRHLHHRQMAQRLAGHRHLQLHDHVQRFVDQLRKRVRGIDRQRRQHRPHFGAVVILHPDQVIARQIVEIQKADAVLRQRRQKLFAPAGVLLIHHVADALVDRQQRFARRQPVEVALDDFAFDLLLDAGDAHLEELIQVRAGDRQEFHPLQERIARVQRFVHHPLIKIQPAQLAVEEVRGPERGSIVGVHLPEKPILSPPEPLWKAKSK